LAYEPVIPWKLSCQLVIPAPEPVIPASEPVIPASEPVIPASEPGPIKRLVTR
jgi:hypothetical protein